MVLYPNKLPESERVCFGICTNNLVNRIAGRYLGSFNRSGTSWNTQVSKRTYMGLNDG